MATVDNLDTKQLIVPTRKAIKTRARNRKTSQKKQWGKGDSKGKGHIDMSKLSAIIAENLDILQGIAQKHAITLLLLKEVSKMASWNPCWI